MSKTRKGPMVLVLLVGVPVVSFLLGGGIWSFTSSLESYTQLASYQPARCTILSKHLLTQTLKDRQTYLPHFTFRVQTTRSQPYQASGYGVDLVYSDDRAWAQTVLDRYRIGKSSPCWYNPANPSQAVLTRDLPLRSLILAALVTGAGAVSLLVVVLLASSLGKLSVRSPVE
jgi:hypothetical protein